jgi:hypothetical protein
MEQTEDIETAPAKQECQQARCRLFIQKRLLCGDTEEDNRHSQKITRYDYKDNPEKIHKLR